MATWFDSIKAELEKLGEGDLIEPMMEVGERDHVIGEVSDTDIKRLYALSLIRGQAASVAFSTARQLGMDEGEAFMRKAARLEAESRLMMGAFWITVSKAFGLLGKPSIGVRKGWKVVWTETDTTEIPEASDTPRPNSPGYL